MLPLLLLGYTLCAFAKPKKIKPVKEGENPPAYAAFSRALSPDDSLRHALGRLTFGPRPGDVDRLEATGLMNWLDNAVHPERVREPQLLAERLAPLETLRLSVRQTYLEYPSPQTIAAVARRNGPLPDDPELRAIVSDLANRYLRKRDGTASQADDSDLDSRVDLNSILKPEQVEALRKGSADQKRTVLESVPPERWTDFAWALTRAQRQQFYGLAPVGLRRQLMRTVNPQGVIASDLSEAKLLRAVYSDNQLEELLTDFWYNHFNVYLDKGNDRYLVAAYEREAIRPHLFGKFYDLVLATAQSPAMLYYLDNWQSSAQEGNPKRGRRRGLNENYGRELLELHTLGVDGGYTQKDVTEVARCFTGWTIAAQRKGSGFEYNDHLHDHGRKVVLGHVIKAGGGMDDGLKVLAILANHQSTAHFISLQLARRFVADDPPPSLVNRMAKTFKKSKGDLRKVVETMIDSGEFWSQGAYRAKVKTPFEMVVSAVRATGADLTSAYLLANELRRLGQPLYQKQEPTGYSSANATWISSASLLDRMNFSIALAHNRVPGVTVDVAPWQAAGEQDPIALARAILERDPSEQTKAAIQKMLGAEDLQKELAKNAKAGKPRLGSLVAGLSLGSPEFQRH